MNTYYLFSQAYIWLLSLSVVIVIIIVRRKMWHSNRKQEQALIVSTLYAVASFIPYVVFNFVDFRYVHPAYYLFVVPCITILSTGFQHKLQGTRDTMPD